MIDTTFPLVELHRHLDGSVRLETILELSLHYGLPLPATDLEGLRPFVQVTEPKPSLLDFFEKFHWPTSILKDMDAVRRVAYENVEDAACEGIAYIELRFSPWFMAEANHLDPAAVVEAVVDGTQAGERDFGLKANLIGILSRTYGVEIAWKELEALLTQKIISQPLTWQGMKSTILHDSLQSILPKAARRDGRSPYTQGRLMARRVCGRHCATSRPHA